METELAKFYIHYNVDDHFISMNDFIIASKCTQKVINDLNQQILGGNLKYDLVIMPPDSGTLLKSVGLVFLALTATPIIQNYALGAFEGLTKHSPAYYGGEHTKALVDLTTGFFSKDVEHLEKCIPREINLDSAFKAKSDFFLSCQHNKKINGLGFDSSDKFPINSSDFAYHITKDRIKPIASDFLIHEAILISPVTEDKDIKWVLQDAVTGQKISADMKDDFFKQGLLSGKYPVKNSKESDTLKILVEYKKQERNGVIEKKDTCINAVYIFNDIEIIPVPKTLPKGVKFQKSTERPMDKIWGHSE